MTNREIDEARFNGAIAKAMAKLNTLDPASAEYATILDQVVKLHKMKETESPSRLDKNTLATIAANLTGIVLVLQHEHMHVVASKAFSLITKLR